MALPTAIGTSRQLDALGHSYPGPFISSGGNVYGFLYDGSANIEPWKASDPTSSFTEQTNWTPTVVPYSHWCAQEGNTIHVFVQGTFTGDDADVYVNTYTMDSDSWGGPTTIKDHGATDDVDYAGVTAIVRSDGDRLACYNGTREAVMGADRGRLWWMRDEGSGWGNETELTPDASYGETDLSRVHAVRGASDKAHVFWLESASSIIEHLSIDSANNASSIETAASSGTQNLGGPVYYNDSGTERIAMLTRNSTPAGGLIRVVDDATPAAVIEPLDNGPVANINMAGLAVSSTGVLYVIYRTTSPAVVEGHADSPWDGTDWGTDSTLQSSTVALSLAANSYTRSGSEKIAYFYEVSGDTVYYDEISLGAPVTQPYYVRTGGVPGMKIGRPGTIFGRSW